MEPEGNVVQLDSYRTSDRNIALRQDLVREATEGYTTGENASVAFAGVTIAPDGSVSTSACLIEPEYVPVVVEELSGLMARLMRFMRAERRMAVAGACLALLALDLHLAPVLASSF